jgi:hypothetical protein
MRKKFIISSRDKNSGTNSNFKITIDKPIGPIHRLYLEGFRIPHSWYTIMSGINDQLTVDDGTDYVVTLTEGYYNKTDLATHIQSAIRSAYTPDNLHTCTYDSLTEKFTIAHPSTNFSLNFATTTRSCASTLGYNDVDTSSGLSHTADNIYNLIYSEYIQIQSPQLGESGFRTPRYNADLVKIVHVDVAFGSWITYENQGSHYYIDKEGKNLNIVEVQLSFKHDGPLVPLNGKNWYMIFSYD